MSVSTSCLLAAILVAVGSAAVSVQDFDESKSGYEFIYHDNQDVIITIHRNKCYFSQVPDNQFEWGLSDTQLPFVGSFRDRTEGFLIKTITDNNADIVHQTSLEAMRNKYQDLLADFHCLDKHIFELVFHYPSGDYHHHGH